MSESRAKLKDALAGLLDGRSYDEISIDQVCAAAGVDRQAFEESFESLEECLLEIWREAAQAFVSETMEAFNRERTWVDGFRAGAWATYRFIERDHQRARLYLYKLEVGGEAIRAERDQLLQLYIDQVHSGRLETPNPEAFPRDVAVGIASAIWERINLRVTAGEFERGPDDVPDLIYLAMLPYFGPEVAEEELRRGRVEAEKYRKGTLIDLE